ncbi:HAMP domain-containing protein [Gemella sp. GH3]|uniref:ATP-binding protein n=1 Tax=unclassified Gemella TaxID=2624949 RepID=UPI0015D0411E|nr:MULTISPECIES: ATP-binding protein [unclassified Gemella]MBF0714596.1 HAMP domain-containing protein [Gemella sp. GH3.1]NYS51548.1 HAMP domain-containing protein [Gemella sp. GH3]
MALSFKQNKRFFTSIRFKFLVVYVLVNIISLQLIGLYFTTQLKTKNITNFQNTIIEQEKKLNYNVMEELTKNSSDDKERQQIESNIRKTVSEFSTTKLLMVNVVDKDLKIIASSTTNSSENYLGKRSVDPIVNQVIKTGESSSKEQIDENQRIYWVYASPIKSGSDVIGVTYIVSDIGSVYSDVDDVINIFIIGTILSMIATVFIGFFASKTITNSIEKMSLQVKEMADGNYEEIKGINTKDEIGDLAVAFNKISKQIKEEQRITEAERRKLSTIINSMKDGIIATDNNGRIVLINDSAREMLYGSGRDIFIGKNCLEILNITEYNTIEEILEVENSLLVSIVDDNKDELLYRIEFNGIIADNLDSKYFSTFKSEGYIIVLYDVTEQERQEKERRDFVSTVSHELRTPLTTMSSYVEALEDGVINDEKLAPVFIDTIQKETTRMIRMVEELMQLGKMDIKEEHYDKEFIDINKLIETIVARFKITHTDKLFALYLPKEPVFVEGDQDKLIQVFDNIINNAVKYSPDGKNITIRVRQNYNQNRVSISIKDEGIGIPLAHIDKIFNRFYRVDKSRQRSMGGTGLGLALSKSIIEAHKGRIWAQSREGYGTIIFVMLPSENLTDEWE